MYLEQITPGDGEATHQLCLYEVSMLSVAEFEQLIQRVAEL